MHDAKHAAHLPNFTSLASGKHTRSADTGVQAKFAECDFSLDYAVAYTEFPHIKNSILVLSDTVFPTT